METEEPDLKMNKDSRAQVRGAAETFVRIILLANGGGLTLCTSVMIALITSHPDEPVPRLLGLAISLFGSGFLSSVMIVLVDLVYRAINSVTDAVPWPKYFGMVAFLLLVAVASFFAAAFTAQHFLTTMGK